MAQLNSARAGPLSQPPAHTDAGLIAKREREGIDLRQVAIRGLGLSKLELAVAFGGSAMIPSKYTQYQASSSAQCAADWLATECELSRILLSVLGGELSPKAVCR